MFLSFFLFVVAHMSPTTYSIRSKKKANHSKKLCNVLIKGKIISLASIYYLYLALVDSSTLDQNAKKREQNARMFLVVQGTENPDQTRMHLVLLRSRVFTKERRSSRVERGVQLRAEPERVQRQVGRHLDRCRGGQGRRAAPPGKSK